MAVWEGLRRHGARGRARLSLETMVLNLFRRAIVKAISAVGYFAALKIAYVDRYLLNLLHTQPL